MAIQNLAFKQQEKQKEIRASKLKYHNQLKMYSLLGGLASLLVIAGILLRNNRNKQKANTLLEQQKEKVENTLSELKYSFLPGIKQFAFDFASQFSWHFFMYFIFSGSRKYNSNIT